MKKYYWTVWDTGTNKHLKNEDSCIILFGVRELAVRYKNNIAEAFDGVKKFKVVRIEVKVSEYQYQQEIDDNIFGEENKR